MYKLVDLDGGELICGAPFKSKREIIERLARYHNEDFKETEGKDLLEWLDKTFQTDDEKLNTLCELGHWKVIEAIRGKIWIYKTRCDKYYADGMVTYSYELYGKTWKGNDYYHHWLSTTRKEAFEELEPRTLISLSLLNKIMEG